MAIPTLYLPPKKFFTAVLSSNTIGIKTPTTFFFLHAIYYNINSINNISFTFAFVDKRSKALTF